MEASSRIEELEEIVKQLISKEQENEKIILQQEQLINQLLINNEEIKNKIQKIEEKGTKMEIVVRNRNNCTFTINIMSTDQLSMIFNKMEYDETKYDLSYLGIVLNPLYTFEFYSIPNHSLITIFPRNEANTVIFIKKNSRDFIPLSIDPENTIENIYEILKKTFEIDVEKHKLFYSGQKLNENKKIQDYLMKNYSTISLSPPVGSILINVNLGNEINQYYVNQNDTIQKIHDEFVSYNDENASSVLICNGEQLECHKKVQDYSISNLSTIFIQTYKRNLIIHIYSQKDLFNLNNYDAKNKVSDLKLRIEEDMGYPIDEQRLFYNNEEELFDYRIFKFYAFKDYYTPISLYHVPKGSSLISVKLEVNSYVYNCKIVVNPSTLIRDIKEQLNDRKVIPLFIPLMYNGQVLEDDKSVQYYNMPTQPEEKILLKANLSYKLGDKKKITLFVSLNCEFNIYVDPSDLVVELKKFLMLKLNVSYYFIKIEYSDHELEDQRSLIECGIIESWPSIKAKIYSHRPINY